MNKPVYYDGSGQLPKEVLEANSQKSQVVITPEVRKNLSGNPFVVENKPSYYDGSGQLPQSVLDANSRNSQAVEITSEVRKNIGGNPFVAAE